jgi:hypothetical protein
MEEQDTSTAPQIATVTDNLAKTWSRHLNLSSEGWETRFERISYLAASSSLPKGHNDRFFDCDHLIGSVAYTILMSALVEEAVKDPLLSEARRSRARDLAARLQISTLPLLLKALPWTTQLWRHISILIRRQVIKIRTALSMT